MISKEKVNARLKALKILMAITALEDSKNPNFCIPEDIIEAGNKCLDLLITDVNEGINFVSIGKNRKRNTSVDYDLLQVVRYLAPILIDCYKGFKKNKEMTSNQLENNLRNKIPIDFQLILSTYSKDGLSLEKYCASPTDDIYIKEEKNKEAWRKGNGERSIREDIKNKKGSKNLAIIKLSLFFKNIGDIRTYYKKQNSLKTLHIPEDQWPIIMEINRKKLSQIPLVDGGAIVSEVPHSEDQDDDERIVNLTKDKDFDTISQYEIPKSDNLVIDLHDIEEGSLKVNGIPVGSPPYPGIFDII